MVYVNERRRANLCRSTERKSTVWQKNLKAARRYYWPLGMRTGQHLMLEMMRMEHCGRYPCWCNHRKNKSFPPCRVSSYPDPEGSRYLENAAWRHEELLLLWCKLWGDEQADTNARTCEKHYGTAAGSEWYKMIRIHIFIQEAWLSIRQFPIERKIRWLWLASCAVRVRNWNFRCPATWLNIQWERSWLILAGTQSSNRKVKLFPE